MLRLSDIVSGGVCVAYDVVMGKKASLERFGSQVVYRVVGRTVNESTNLPSLSLPVVSENDIYTAVTAMTDSKLRKHSSSGRTVEDGLRAGLSSLAVGYVMNTLNISDKIVV